MSNEFGTGEQSDQSPSGSPKQGGTSRQAPKHLTPKAEPTGKSVPTDEPPLAGKLSFAAKPAPADGDTAGPTPRTANPRPADGPASDPAERQGLIFDGLDVPADQVPPVIDAPAVPGVPKIPIEPPVPDASVGPSSLRDSLATESSPATEAPPAPDASDASDAGVRDVRAVPGGRGASVPSVAEAPDVPEPRSDLYVPATYRDPQPEATPPVEAIRHMPFWMRGALTAVMAAALVSALILTRGFGLLAGKTLPNVVGYSEQDASSLLKSEGYSVKIEEQETQVVNDGGKVIATNPVASEQVPAGAIIVLKVGHVGIETREVPALVGLTEQEAVDQIGASAFFVKDDITYTHSNTVEEGHIISQGPVAGSLRTMGTKIDLVVSMGPSSSDDEDEGGLTSISVPDVTGMDYDDALVLLEGMGLTVERGEDVATDILANGTVAQVDPPVNTDVRVGGTVVVHMAVPTGTNR